MTGVDVPTTITPVGLRKKRRSGRFQLATPLWALPGAAFLVLFLVAPLIANVGRSLVPDSPADGQWSQYYKLLTDGFYLGVLGETFKASAITTAVCAVVGYPVAFFMVRYAKKWNSLILFCLIAPLLTSVIMRTFGWTILFSRRGVINHALISWGVINAPLDVVNRPILVYMGLVQLMLPFMVLSIISVLQTVDVRLEESARLLGANRVRTFFKITLPLSMDGVATGCIVVLMLTNGSFLTMLLLGGGSVQTLALLIFQQFNLSQKIGFAAAMGNLLLIFSLLCLWLQARYIRRRGEA